MKTWNVLVGISLAFTLAACGGQADEEENQDIPAGGDSTMSGEWLFTVDQQLADDMLYVEMYIENDSEEAQTLTFPSQQLYEITLVNAQEEEVFRYSNEHMFAQSVTEKTYEPGETQDLREEIPTENIPAGSYMMTVELLVDDSVVESLSDPGTFTKLIEVEISESE
ncbi:BsuPI-related putative proteinase inhibitor [Shouchella lehensis]|uniref:Intracellular proteinase inhibitor n=1 Tax=Shouchella lehensis G1 TaxID=1246626 RepID=A0A060LY88_9BACI|nr:BsuPI-related putative proteinase inhibitor [Shouchella lehensis]AIC95132.1 intracellular proteinase inhibitor [Shouchella lehensis G1]